MGGQSGRGQGREGARGREVERCGRGWRLERNGSDHIESECAGAWWRREGSEGQENGGKRREQGSGKVLHAAGRRPQRDWTPLELREQRCCRRGDSRSLLEWRMMEAVPLERRWGTEEGLGEGLGRTVELAGETTTRGKIHR